MPIRSAMPFEHNAARRRHIPKARYRICNWPSYQAALRRRRDLADRDRQGSDRGWNVQPHGRPSSSLASLRNNTLDRLGISLDDKMESLTAALACPAGAQSEGRDKKPPINAV